MIYFETEHKGYLPKERLRLRRWLKALAALHGNRIRSLGYQFLTDEEVLEANREYLEHDYYTDVITFDNREETGEGPIEGDILISADRVRDNAATYGVAPEHELRRVLAHGLLHLLGFKDKTKAEAAAMRQAEDDALALWEQTI